MEKILGKVLGISTICLTVVMVLSVALPVLAQTGTTGTTDQFGLTAIGGATGLSTGKSGDLRVVIGNVIKVALSFLGVIAIVIILIGGFKYMTAGGDTEKVKGAQNYIMYGIIGLAIILAAYAISSFVLTETQKAISE
ncbi:hypothetical protein HZB94_04455 [Candidatus Falkowbacteria bacterium]|nr:hypothetical protein [Candidatus Falkowbacteria bacterium]